MTWQPKSRAVMVRATATRLDTSDVSADSVSGSSIVFYNNGSTTIYQGGMDVTTSNGAPVPAGTWSVAVDLSPSEALYGIVVSGTAEARVLESGV